MRNKNFGSRAGLILFTLVAVMAASCGRIPTYTNNAQSVSPDTSGGGTQNGGGSGGGGGGSAVSFSATILPMLQASCVSCHGAMFDSYAGIMGSGEVLAGSPSASLVVTATAPGGIMAPHAPAGLNADLSAWVAAGAPNN